VGDIPFDAAIDNPAFELIDEDNILPYNTICGFYIEGERYAVLNYFRENVRLDTIKGATGYITIRFIVNHKGQTDRFRVYEMDNNYKTCYFPSGIKDSLLTATKRLDGWITLDKDYYQYILFKMKDGQIETILP
jgi:hypothetical protein